MRYRKPLKQKFFWIFLLALLSGCGEGQIAFTPTPPPPRATEPQFKPCADNPAACPRFEINDELYLRQVQTGAFVLTHQFPWGAANSLVVEMADGTLVLVDTPYALDATEALVDWLQTRYGAREMVAINSGHHLDNLGGNAYLVEQGIPVYGADLTAQLVQERGEQSRTFVQDWLKAHGHEQYIRAFNDLPPPPTILFPAAEGLEMVFGAETVQVYYPGPSQAPDKIVVYFPDKKILFGGCMVIGWDGIGNTADADMAHWPDALRQLSRFDAEIVVPGHGERLDPGLLEHTINLLTQ